MARSTYSGGTVTERITVEHTWGSDERHVVVNVVLPGGHPVARLAMPADVMREVGQALIGAADQFAADDDVTEPEVAPEAARPAGKVQTDDVDHRGATMAERRVLAALSGTQPRTPAELKRRMPGATPVGTVRSLLGSLQAKGLARPAADLATEPGATGWVSVGAGVAHSDAERQASLEAAQANLAASLPEVDKYVALPLTTAERTVWYALRVTSGRKVSAISTATGLSEGTVQTLLESLEAQGYARQYTHDTLGVMWRSADPEGATIPQRPWQAAYDHARHDGASHADAMAVADRAEAAVHATRGGAR